jgi:hypothetical protein
MTKSSLRKTDMVNLREALEASWDFRTANHHVSEARNPALGQCYPTSRVVQILFPETEIVEGQVQTNKGIEKHFWNVLVGDGATYHIDFTWQQFPSGSSVKSYKVRNRNTLGDSQGTIDRVELLLKRVEDYLSKFD